MYQFHSMSHWLIPITNTDVDIIKKGILIFDLRSKTPGGRLVYLYTKKRVATPKCPCGTKLSGVSSTLHSSIHTQLQFLYIFLSIILCDFFLFLDSSCSTE